MRINKLPALCAALILILHTEPVFSQKQHDSSFRKEKKTLRLFDGKSLDGWYTFIKDRGRDSDPKKVFTVQDGMIRITGEEWGSLTTNKNFKNYRLVTEFMWGDETFEPRKDKARDCGLLLHSRGKDGGSGGIWMNSIECQIIEGGTGDIIIVGDGTDNFRVTAEVASGKPGYAYVFQKGGHPVTLNSGRINWFGRDANWKDTIGFRGKNDVEKPVGEWNTLECIVNKDHLTIFLNGVLVNEATNVKPQKGRIQIQSEGAEIFFRKVELTPIK